MSDMAGESGSPAHKRDSIKTPVGNIAGQRRRQQALSVGKERRDAMVRAKRLCRVDDNDESTNIAETDVAMDDEIGASEEQTVRTVEELKSAASSVYGFFLSC